MALTITSTNTLSLLNILNRTSIRQSASLTRLSTGLRINKGSDDPAGLIALRGLESELTSVDAAIVSNTRTAAILGVADGALSEVAELVKEISKLAAASTNSAALSPSEIAANQSQIDNALESIDRIVRTTQFNGKKLLDGSLGINVSGVTAANITDVRVYSRNTASTNTSLAVNVVSAATQASISGYVTTSASSDTSITVQGKLGTVVIDISSGENLSSVASKINDATGQTGVTASASGANLSLSASDYGSSAFVRVTTLSGDTTNYTAKNATGTDANVTVNGQKAAVDGLAVNYSANGLNLTFNLSSTFNQSAGNDTFSVTTGGATFQLGTDGSTRVTIGIDGLFSHQLGSSVNGYLSSLKSGGANSLVNDPNQASIVAAKAMSAVATAQGRLGGFTKFQVETALNSMNATKIGLEVARSVIADVDYAQETAELNKQNVLLQSAIVLLGIANQQSGQVLSLLL